MHLDIQDAELTKAMIERMRELFTKQFMNENSAMVKDLAKQTLENMWSTHSADFQKAFKAQFVAYGSFPDNVLKAIRENAKPLIDAIDTDGIVAKHLTQELVGKAVDKCVLKYLETPSAQQRIENIIGEKVQEIFIRKFMLQDLLKPSPSVTASAGGPEGA